MNYIVSIALLIVALISPTLFSRGKFLVSLEQHRPTRLQRFRTPVQWELKLADKVRNCEDIVIDDVSRWAILSCDPSRDYWNPVMGFLTQHETTEGALYLYDFAGEHKSADALIPLKLLDFADHQTNFHPLGITYHAPSKRLFVINVAKGGTRIEVFKLFLDEGAATHVKTIKHRHLPSPNQIHAISADEIYVSNDHYFTYPANGLLQKIETYGALPIAPIAYVDLSDQEPRVFTVARHAFSNGLVQLNATTYAAASTSAGVIRLYEVDPEQRTKAWVEREKIPTPMFPDNLSIDQDGVLYVAGHPHPLSTAAHARTQTQCSKPENAHLEKCKKDSSSPSLVASWTKEQGLKILYLDDEFSTACSAVKDVKSGIGLVSSLYGKGILTWKE